MTQPPGPQPSAGGPAPTAGGVSVAAPALAERVAAAVTAHPAVARLDDGIFGGVATHLPGRRLTGVRIGRVGEPVELAVVLRLGHPLPGVVAALRREVSALCGGVAVDITVADLDIPAEAIGPPAVRRPGGPPADTAGA